MEKLIELLNEYDSGWDYDDYYGPYQYGQDRDAYKYGKYYLISREYEFIKWLVENDKIDVNHIDKVVKECGTDGIGAYYCECYPAYESLLMLLSISDTPIEDLLLYLK